jgi:uncharacterized protein YneF (UPF0154 family)
MSTVALIFIIWLAVSVPVALFLGRFIAVKSTTESNEPAITDTGSAVEKSRDLQHAA